jgi:hypothetical protein
MNKKYRHRKFLLKKNTTNNKIGIKESNSLSGSTTTKTEILEAGDSRKKTSENEEPPINPTKNEASFIIQRNPSRSDNNNNNNQIKNNLKPKINVLTNKKSEKIEEKIEEQKCKFNGYSNNEILLFFFLALFMTILIAFDYSNVISHVSSLVYFKLISV